MDLTISPYSLSSYEWSVNWVEQLKVTGNERKSGTNKSEMKLLKALMVVPIIGSKQAELLFGLTRKKADKMISEKKIIKHTVVRNNQTIPIFTLGELGAEIVNHPHYHKNYWSQYEIKSILKCLSFYNLYQYFSEFEMWKVQQPFTGIIRTKKSDMYVYVLNDKGADLQRYLLYDEDFVKRMIIITEKKEYVEPLIPLLAKSQIKLRVALDSDIFLKLETGVNNKMYFLDAENNQLIKDEFT
ncbi:hypothetical protein ACQKM9_17235 [Viridibacillus sp. NPDC093762]|uniref:hypothetical protein n=1 Tax=Viridibacillus sp. NPDC093762 TaxID=3390720 RepID=UPI003D0332A3